MARVASSTRRGGRSSWSTTQPSPLTSTRRSPASMASRASGSCRGAKRHDPLARLAMLAGERRVDVNGEGCVVDQEERPPLLVDDATLAIDVDQEDDILAGGAIRHRAGKAK